MRKKRLLKLADVVERAIEAKAVKFDLTTWGHNDREAVIEMSCGTTACLLGTAALSGEFKGAGMGYCVRKYDDGSGAEMDITFARGAPFQDGHMNTFANAAWFFGITRDEAQFLFDPRWYPNIRHHGKGAARYAIKRVRDFVARGGIPE